MSSTPVSSRPSEGTWWSTANTSGSTRTRPSTSACWATRRSPFPIEWASSKIPGYAIRASMPNFHGFTAFVVMSSVAARFFGPQVSGIGADAGRQRGIPHRPRRDSSTRPLTCNTSRGRTRPWFSFNWRYDSGLVAGPGALRGRQLRQRAERDRLASWTSPILRRISSSRPDSSAAACYATPTTPISPTGLCPASQYGSKFYQIPAAGTENDDHNPPRIASRNLFDLALGDDNIFHGDKYKWSARLTVVNLTNKEALYNFLSTFSGTHYVSPRAITATIGFHF